MPKQVKEQTDWAVRQRIRRNAIHKCEPFCSPPPLSCPSYFFQVDPPHFAEDCTQVRCMLTHKHCVNLITHCFGSRGLGTSLHKPAPVFSTNPSGRYPPFLQEQSTLINRSKKAARVSSVKARSYPLALSQPVNCRWSSLGQKAVYIPSQGGIHHHLSTTRTMLGCMGCGIAGHQLHVHTFMVPRARQQSLPPLAFKG